MICVFHFPAINKCTEVRASSTSLQIDTTFGAETRTPLQWLAQSHVRPAVLSRHTIAVDPWETLATSTYLSPHPRAKAEYLAAKNQELHLFDHGSLLLPSGKMLEAVARSNLVAVPSSPQPQKDRLGWMPRWPTLFHRVPSAVPPPAQPLKLKHRGPCRCRCWMSLREYPTLCRPRRRRPTGGHR